MSIKIHTIHVEISTFCNASCVGCTRQQTEFPKLHLDYVNHFNNIEKDILENVKKFQLCGTYGDPILHPEFLKICDWIISNSNAVIEISTNGNPHKTDWWENLAEILKGRGYVIFGLDGLEDTHSIYRKNTDFNTIIQNASTFINNDGEAWWQFIPFEHNEHQIIKAKKLSQQLGFKKFFIKDERHAQKYGLKSWKHSRVSTSVEKKCLFTEGTIYIQGDGIVKPCCYMGDFKIKEFSRLQLTKHNINELTQELDTAWKTNIPIQCKNWCNK